ncbi:hypothetical protein ABPH35_05400 [Streptococcus sp. ZJ93]|uniref:hypothetical protein n=1 Tax=Streptococcus handemini TaxID=3161188 RepID=UPI0032EB848F
MWWNQPEEFAWTYAKTNNFDEFKKRLMYWIESWDYDSEAESTKRLLKGARQSFVNQRRNGHRKVELQSEYWDKVIDYLAVAYYGERPGHLFTTSINSLRRPVDEFSKDIQRIVWRFAETEDVEGAEKCLTGFVRLYLNDVHLFKLEPVFKNASEILKEQRSHREDMDSEYWEIMIHNLDHMFADYDNNSTETVNRGNLEELFKNVIEANRKKFNNLYPMC